MPACNLLIFIALRIGIQKPFRQYAIIEGRIALKDCRNAVLYPGLFPQTAHALADKRFCFVHIDVDIHASVKDCLEFFFAKMVEGGVMIFDDWEKSQCPGVRKAITDFLASRKEKPIVLASGQCVIIKLGSWH